MEPVTLRTDRLVLSIPTAADVDAITDACQDPEVPRWTTVPSPYTRENAEEFVEQVVRWWADGEETVWAIRRDGALAGMIGLHRITAHTHGGDAEIGYWGTAAFRGQASSRRPAGRSSTGRSESSASPGSAGARWPATCRRPAPRARSASATRASCDRG